MSTDAHKVNSPSFKRAKLDRTEFGFSFNTSMSVSSQIHAFQVHQVRYHIYQPAAIEALAYDSLNQNIAVSRADGSLEIWSGKDDWYQQQIIPSYGTTPSEALLWINGILFASGDNGFLHQYDLMKSRSQFHSSSGSIGITCLATNAEQSIIAAGTADGFIAFFELTSDEGPVFQRTSTRPEGRIFCMSWCHQSNTLMTGGINSVTIWNASSGQIKLTITVPKQSAHKDTNVWAIAVTTNGTIITGDSRGVISFWNSEHGALINSFKSHKADILCLAVTADNYGVFCSGVEPIVTQYRRIEATPGVVKWVRGDAKSALHTHDVKAMVVAKDTLISGGQDCHLVLSQFTNKKSTKEWRKTGRIPHRPMAQTARKVEATMLRYPDSLELWKLGTTDQPSEVNGEYLEMATDSVKLIKLNFGRGDIVLYSAIADNAEWIAYTTTNTLRLYRIRSVLSDPKPLPVRHAMCKTLGSSLLAFTKDNQRLIAVQPCGTVNVIELSEKSIKLAATIEPPTLSTSGCHLLSTSDNGRYVATADHDSNIHIYGLKKKQHIVSLPCYDRQPTAMSFHPQAAHFIVAYSDQKIMEYDIKAQGYTIWSRQLNNSWHQQWLKRTSKITNLYYQPGKEHLLHVIDEQMLCIIDQTQRLPMSNDQLFDKASWQTDTIKSTHCFHFCSRFKYLLHVSPLAENSLVIVERPPLDIDEALPPPFTRKIFGT